ncbi:MAG TPA: PHB depolymerase family esterase [Bradyrhizobium sp.]|uniref:extracellular catalytic domain type 1 short-chain-length polyhydroxyalkanoate depolymerase n=1 Tax=Bradyrhizobium sp. TaxID=376 RepID=UPI002D80B211|nr:PHB depolymerase family esterase [Bradyrhizobium sp.]HET7885836.1 PHB depolymerase family esterase [Bradyrhizobium sp.]
MSLAKNIEFLRHLPRLPGLHGWNGLDHMLPGGIRSPMVETRQFGTNPGDLRMYSYVPPDLPPSPALVVVLHGCGQTAAGYDIGTGWSTLAKHYGFVLLMPEQQASNNAHGCFNWFNPEDTKRGHGEACSIRQMIARMVSQHRIDKHRVFITGLSAGGAMTSVMLATYPEVFAAGAIIAGLPYGVASNVREALSGMLRSPARSSHELGNLVRNACKHRAPWPRVSVWHGTADRTVNPANADEIVKQWLDVHRLPPHPMAENIVDGHPHQVWWNSDGETVVESYTITDMAHGTPLGKAENDERYGKEGAFLIEAGISSSYHIANFFGLTGGVAKPAKSPSRARQDSPSAKLIPLASPLQASVPDLTKVLQPLIAAKPAPNSPPKPKPGASAKSAPKRRRALDVSAVITRALTAAGLMK